MVNAARQSEGLPRLVRESTLERLAQRHARAMQKSARLAHNLGEGDPKQRVLATGLRVRETGENVARAASIRRAHRVIWASPSHRANLLYPEFDKIGIGVAMDADGGVWACQLFAELARQLH
jgi:uncharacterized protein YkwD